LTSKDILQTLITSCAINQSINIQMAMKTDTVLARILCLNIETSQSWFIATCELKYLKKCLAGIKQIISLQK
jgi:hypothetical protein